MLIFKLNLFKCSTLLTFFLFLFTGWLYDETKSYAPGFYGAGGAIALSGVILFLIPIILKRQESEKNDYGYTETPLEEI